MPWGLNPKACHGARLLALAWSHAFDRDGAPREKLEQAHFAGWWVGAAHTVSHSCCASPLPLFPLNCSNDIVGFKVWVPSNNANGYNWIYLENSRNFSIYVSPTAVYRNGTLCVGSVTVTNTDLVPNNFTCPRTLSNARYGEEVVPATCNCGMPILHVHTLPHALLADLVYTRQTWNLFCIHGLQIGAWQYG